MITCNLCGGLGNQLFQIFTTIAYSITNKLSFYFPSKKELLNGSIIRYTYWDSMLDSLKPFLKNNYDKVELIREQGFCYNKLPSCNSNGSIMLVGYFQSHKYFDTFKSSICKMLKIENKKMELKQQFHDIINFDNTISIHFRLGDYKKHPHIYRLLDESYYMRALQIILTTSNINTPIKVLFFCEDESLLEVEEMIHKIQDKIELIQIDKAPVLFERAPTGLDDWKELLLMSLCKYNIIANSTFSWWGAYLNMNDDKIVCCPKEWFMPQTNNNIKDLFPDDWIKVITE